MGDFNDNWPIIGEEMTIDGIKLVLTCGACPEQYDAFDVETGQQVGYLRLRHGGFRVDVPDCGGRTVYAAEPKGDGIFDDDEREHYLREAVAAIKAAAGDNDKAQEPQG
jgi:hypothetical protein